MAEADGPYRGLTGEEVAARRLLERHGLSLPPADILELVSLYADVEEEVYPVRGDAVLIEFPQGHKKPLIVLNAARKYPVRRRFTLAHELAHILLGWHFGNFSCSPVDDEKYLSGDYGEMEGEANRFAAELLLPTPWVEAFIDRAETTADLVGGILANAWVSIDTARIKLMKCLPAGYVCVIEDSTTGRVRLDASKGTPTNLLCDYSDLSDPKSLYSKLDGMAIDGHMETRPQRQIRWWKVDCSCPLPNLKDDKSSTEILRFILEDLFLQEALVRKMEQRINGMVGATNTSAITREPDSIYGVLKLRFEKRDVRDDTNLWKIASHPAFLIFLINKSKELALGPDRKRALAKGKRKLLSDNLFE